MSVLTALIVKLKSCCVLQGTVWPGPCLTLQLSPPLLSSSVPTTHPSHPTLYNSSHSPHVPCAHAAPFAWCVLLLPRKLLLWFTAEIPCFLGITCSLGQGRVLLSCVHTLCLFCLSTFHTELPLLIRCYFVLLFLCSTRTVAIIHLSSHLCPGIWPVLNKHWLTVCLTNPRVLMFLKLFAKWEGRNIANCHSADIAIYVSSSLGSRIFLLCGSPRLGRLYKPGPILSVGEGAILCREFLAKLTNHLRKHRDVWDTVTQALFSCCI